MAANVNHFSARPAADDTKVTWGQSGAPWGCGHSANTAPCSAPFQTEDICLLLTEAHRVVCNS